MQRRQGFLVNFTPRPLEKAAGLLQREAQIIRSKLADPVLNKVPLPEPGEERAYSDAILALLEGLPSTILVRNAGPFKGSLV